MLFDLVMKNRSYRRFYEDVPVSEDTLLELTDLARRTASAANLQPIRYKLVSDKTMCEKVFECLGWAGYYKDWPGPEEGERPAAYIILASSEKANPVYTATDEGIACQTILLGATEKGLGGCIFANIKRDRLKEIISLPRGMKIDYVIAIGKPKEKAVLEDMVNDDCKYYRDGESVHHVPKRSLKDILL